MKKILFATSEAYPFFKTGGLGDVSYALPKELNRSGYETRVILPLYRDIDENFKSSMAFVASFGVPLGKKTEECSVYSYMLGKTVFYFLENKKFFKHGGAYGFYEDGEKFAFFDRAILETILNLKDFQPDIIHCNDWHTGLVPVLMKEFYKGTKADVKTVYAIHNLQFQGLYSKALLTEALGLSIDYFKDDKLKYYDCISFMKGGIVYCDEIITVSESYAEEIQTPLCGEGLEGVLFEYNYKLKGILNGIDFELYNPETDVSIYKNFSVNNIEGKKENKLLLQKELGLEENKDIPMMGIVSRLTSQKGFDLVTQSMEEILSQNVQLVILGTGDEKYEDIFKYYALKYPDKISANITFSESLARKIYASSDLFLMPSMFEPCGLGQIMALRYGSIPIVRETGGLKDTIVSYNEYTDEGNGFSFENYNAHDMTYVIKYALSRLNYKEKWNILITRAMKNTFNWENSAKKYINMYNNL